MIKKTVSMVLCAIMIMGMGTTAFAANTTSSEPEPESLQIPNYGVERNYMGVSNGGTEIIISDKDAISDYIRLNNIQVPEGATLTEIIITRNNDTSANAPTIENRSSGMIIKNVKVSSGDYVYNDEAEWDKIYNYSSTQNDNFSTSYSQTKTSSWNVGVKASGSIKVVDVEASVGFTLGNCVTNTKTFSTTIPPRKRIEVKIQTNYTLKTYDVYQGNTYIDSGKAWNPKGLLIYKYEYSI